MVGGGVAACEVLPEGICCSGFETFSESSSDLLSEVDGIGSQLSVPAKLESKHFNASESVYNFSSS